MDHKRIHLYIVDDEPGVCRLVSMLFSEYGYDIMEARDGEQFLEKIAGVEPPEVVLLDVMMPGLNGPDVCKILKKDPRLSKIKIIFYSALPENKLKEIAEEAGADSYITKDIELDDLSARVMKILL